MLRSSVMSRDQVTHQWHAAEPAPPARARPPAQALWTSQTERYEDLLRATVDWTWEVDADGRLVYVSPLIARDLGLPAESFLGRRLDEAGRLAEDVPDMDSRRSFRNALYYVPDANGREIAFQLSGVPFFGSRDGRYAGHRGTAVRAAPPPARSEADDDRHTLTRTLEEVLLRHNDLEWRLNQAQESKVLTQDHLAKLLHELRTPLNAMVGYAELALTRIGSDADAGPLGDNIRHIREAGHHMNRLLSELPQTQAPRETADGGDSVATTDLVQVIDDAKAMIELAARRSDIRIQPTQGPETLLVRGDRKALTQIVVNLLSNAVKFTPAGGEIGVRIQETGSFGIRMAVWDTGPGIPIEEQSRIFERNYRMTRHSGADGPPGSGLGLAIARQLARDNGAELSVDSTPGQGAVFHLDLRHAGRGAAA